MAKTINFAIVGTGVDQGSLVDFLSNDLDITNELQTDHATDVTWQTEIDADSDVMNNYLAFAGEQDGASGGNFTFAGQADAAALGAGIVHYKIAGENYSIALDTSITLTGTTVVTGSNWRAWRVVIDRLGVVTTESPDNAGQSTEEKAMLELGSIAQAANTAELGVFTIQAATGFTPATDNTSGEANFNSYELYMPKNEAAALTVAMSTALVLGDGLATMNIGAANFRKNGVRVAQVAADATQALTDADTITTTEAGGWLLLSNLAGTDFVTLSSDGIPGVSALTDTDAATALVALNLLASRLPAVFTPLAYFTVVTSNAATFTAKTTNWNATDVASVAVDQTFGTFDRTATAASVLARQSNPPAVPATVTAPVKSTLTNNTALTLG